MADGYSTAHAVPWMRDRAEGKTARELASAYQDEHGVDVQWWDELMKDAACAMRLWRIFDRKQPPSQGTSDTKTEGP